jgi:hypothetical protein
MRWEAEWGGRAHADGSRQELSAVILTEHLLSRK